MCQRLKLICVDDPILSDVNFYCYKNVISDYLTMGHNLHLSGSVIVK